MLITRNITLRDMVNNYKDVIAKVKKTQEPAIVVTQNEPQVAIISMADLEQLRDLKYKQSALSLLELSKKTTKLIKESGEKLPSNLSQNHDKYLWED